MPDSTIIAPVAADPIDRLTLRCDVVRLSGVAQAEPGSSAIPGYCVCMAEE
jgi:hypothetical protein